MLRVSIFVELRHAKGRRPGDGFRRRAGVSRRDFPAVYCGHDARLRRRTARRGIPLRQSAREPHLRLRIVVQRIASPLPQPHWLPLQARGTRAEIPAAPTRAAFFFFRKGVLDGSMMLAGLLYWLSPARRRFMRRLAKPGLDATRARLAEAGSPRAIQFISTILDANADFLAYALSPKGPLHGYG